MDIEQSKPKFPCTGDLFAGGVCPSSHLKKLQLRCRECDNCLKYRSSYIIATGLQRVELLENNTLGKPDRIYHWVLGTNWDIHTLACDYRKTESRALRVLKIPSRLKWKVKDCDIDCGLAQMRQVWKKFTLMVRHLAGRGFTYEKKLYADYMYWDNKLSYWWDLAYKVLETGNKGGKLHVHLLSFNEIDIHFLKYAWSKLTKIEKPYVALVPDNCKKHRHKDWKLRINAVRNCPDCNYFSTDPIRDFGYLAKYLTKDVGRYYWLGRMNRVRLSKPGKVHCKVCSLPLIKETWVVGSEELVNVIFEERGIRLIDNRNLDIYSF